MSPSGRIPKEIITQIKDAASQDLAVLAQEWGLAVKKSGANHKACCPFHNDKTPSLSLLSNGYYCHGCGESGNVLRLGMELTGKPFPVLVRELAARYSILIPETEEEKQERALKDQVLDVLASAANWYATQLRSPQGQQALEYLVSERSVVEEEIKSWGFGYAPPRGCYEYLSGRYPLDLIVQAGLATQGDYGVRDFFRDRLMIPVIDQGRVIGFGARALGETKSGKYVNSPETIVFPKGKILFGLDQARAAIRKSGEAILVEGYFDVIAAHRNGHKNTVAVLGTAVSPEQIRPLLRLTSRLVSGFDHDEAGRKAADRAFTPLEKLVYSGELSLSMLEFKGKDLDEHFKESAELSDRIPWENWKFYQLLAGFDLADDGQFRQAILAVSGHLRQITNLALRSHYLRFCAAELSKGDHAYALRLEKDLRQGISRNTKEESTKTLVELSSAHILWAYLEKPELRPQIAYWIVTQDYCWISPSHRRLWDLIQSLEEETEEQDLKMFAAQAAPELIDSIYPPEGDLDPALSAAFDHLWFARAVDGQRFILRRWIERRDSHLVGLIVQ